MNVSARRFFVAGSVVLGLAVLIAVAMVYGISPPTVVFGAAVLCFAAAAFVSGRRGGVRAIARAWHGAVPAAKADAYLEYLARTGVPGCQATAGNLGVYVLRRVEQDRAHFLFISLWRSREAIEAFAGADIERARYYPEDKTFLLELEPHVTHYEVLIGPGLGTGTA
jgi:heme-degrading monooxygenase HmoA